MSEAMGGLAYNRLGGMVDGVQFIEMIFGSRPIDYIAIIRWGGLSFQAGYAFQSG